MERTSHKYSFFFTTERKLNPVNTRIQQADNNILTHPLRYQLLIIQLGKVAEIESINNTKEQSS